MPMQEVPGILTEEKTPGGLITVGTSTIGIPTNADVFAPGALITVEGEIYRNSGTSAAPVFENMSEVTSDEVDAGLIQTVIVNLTAAQINALFTTSVAVIPAISGKAIILDDMILDLTGTATQFTAGGVVNLQYKNTANGAGTTLHADIAASVVTGATGRVVTQRIAKDLSATAAADIVGIGVYVGAKTQNFATGTGTARIIARYHTI